MALATALGEVALQLFLLLLTFHGWGVVLASVRLFPGRDIRFPHLLRTIFGLCGFTIFLLITTYANIPLKYSAWAALAVAVTGWGINLREWRHGQSQPSRGKREERLGFTVFAVIFLLQGLPLFWAGPEHYMAMGHIDHYLYTNVSQFLVENPIRLDPAAGWENPWLQTSYTFLNQRLGQDMPIGYLAVILHCDTIRTFGVVSIFYVALLSIAVFGCLRQLQLPPFLAWMFAVWLGLANGITYSSTTSFLSNSSVLFVLPTLVLLLWSRRHHLPSLRFAPALLLSYAFCSYTELFTWIGLTFLILWLTLANWHNARTWRALGASALVSLILVSPYLPRVLIHFGELYRFTVGTVPAWQEIMSNQSGTWRGWRQLFFATLNSRSVPWINLLTLSAAVSFLAIIPWALWIQRNDRSRYLAPLAILIAFWPILLLALPTFKHYAFFKITTTFLPLFFVLLAYGWMRLESSLGSWRMASRVVLTGLVLGSLLSSALTWKTMIQLNGSLLQNTPTMQAISAYVREHPEKTYYLTDTNELRAGWIAYKARHSRVRLAPQTRLVWGFPADPQAKPPAPPYVVLDGERLPYEVR